MRTQSLRDSLSATFAGSVLSRAIAIATTAAAMGVSTHASAIENLKDFNPSMSLILDGVYYHDTIDGEGFEAIEEHDSTLHGHDHGDEHEHGGIGKGFNLRETELTMSGSVDAYFDAYFTAALSDGEFEIEEAWIRTQNLPAGLQLKAGKFLSAVGYQNEKHVHSWDFTDLDIASQSMFGDHGLSSTGAQLTWLAETDSFLQFGVELLQGDELEKFGSNLEELDELAEEIDEEFLGDSDTLTEGAQLNLTEQSRPDLTIAFVRFGPDLGTERALQLGASFANHNRMQSFHEEGAEAFVADGDGTVLGLHAVYKRFATGANGKGGLTVQGEYFQFESDQKATYHTDAAEIGIPLELSQDAAYLQAVYGFAPRWQFGLRTAAAGIGGELKEGGASDELRISRQHSAAITFRPSEFSMLRLQGSRNDIGLEDGREGFNQIMLQYNISLGAHGAHTF